MLSRKIGELPGELQQQINGLSPDQLEDLSEDLLDFDRAADLADWLNQAR